MKRSIGFPSCRHSIVTQLALKMPLAVIKCPPIRFPLSGNVNANDCLFIILSRLPPPNRPSISTLTSESLTLRVVRDRQGAGKLSGKSQIV